MAVTWIVHGYWTSIKCVSHEYDMGNIIFIGYFSSLRKIYSLRQDHIWLIPSEDSIFNVLYEFLSYGQLSYLKWSFVDDGAFQKVC